MTQPTPQSPRHMTNDYLRSQRVYHTSMEAMHRTQRQAIQHEQNQRKKHSRVTADDLRSVRENMEKRDNTVDGLMIGVTEQVGQISVTRTAGPFDDAGKAHKFMERLITDLKVENL